MPAVSTREPTLETRSRTEAPQQPASSSNRPISKSKYNGKTPPSQKKNPPSRERVSAAIALVRARQAAVKASSPVSSAASPTNNSGASIKPDDYGNRGLSPARFPLSPKTQARSPKQADLKALNVTYPSNSPTHTQSPNGSLILNSFSSKVVAPPLPSLALSPQLIEEFLVDQENTPRSKNGPASPSNFIANASRGRSRATAIQLANPRTPTRNPAKSPRKSVQVTQNIVISSAASDDCSVDPDTLADVSRFIDALHQQKGPLSPPAMTGRPSPVIRPPSDFSDDDAFQVDTKTIAQIGNFIDAIAKPKTERVSVSQIALALSDSSSDSVSIPLQTMEDIGSLIDAISKPKAEISTKSNDATGNLTVGVLSPRKEAAVSMLPASPKEEHVAMTLEASPLAQVPLNTSVGTMAISPKTSDARTEAKDETATSMTPRPAIGEDPSDLTDSSMSNLPGNMDRAYAQRTMMHRSIGTDSDSDDDDDDSVPMETRAGIGAFIDRLQKKAAMSIMEAPLSPQAAPLFPQQLSHSQITIAPRDTDGILTQGSILEVSSSDGSCLDPEDDENSIKMETEEDFDAFISVVEKPIGETVSIAITNPRSCSETENRTGIKDSKKQKKGEHVYVETVYSETADEAAMLPVPVVDSTGNEQGTNQFIPTSDSTELIMFNKLSLDEVEEGASSRAPSRAPSCLDGEHLLGGVLSIDLSEEGANPWAPDSYIEDIVDNVKSIDDIEHLRALESFEFNQRRNKELLLHDDDIGAATIAVISNELAEEDKQHELSSKVDYDGDYDGDLVAAFLQGSPSFTNPASPLTFREAILPNCGTMDSIDEDEKMKTFFAKFDMSKGANSEDRDRINYYVKQATEHCKNGTSQAEREQFIRRMLQSGLSNHVVDQFVLHFFPKPSKLSVWEDTRQVIIDEFFSRLIPPQGASKVVLAKYNEFTKVATPLLQINQLSLVQEAELRIAAARAGISAKLIDELLDQTESSHRIELTLSKCSSVESEDPADRFFNEKRFQDIEDIDENDNISAFLSRMSALKEGGHFVGKGESTKEPEYVAEEANVEIDAHHGFVNKNFQPEEEGDWWTGPENVAEKADVDFDANRGFDKKSYMPKEEKEWPTEEGNNNKLTANTYTEEGSNDYHNLKADDPTFSLELDDSLSMKVSDSFPAEKPKEKSMEELTAAIESARLARKKITKVSSSGSVVAIKGQKRREEKRSQDIGHLNPLEHQALVAYNGFQLASPSNIMSSMFTSFLSLEDRATMNSRIYASKWRNPWAKRWRPGKNEKESRRLNLLIDFDEKPKISGVVVAQNLYQRRRVRERAVPVKQLWKASYKERTQYHQGYTNVDVFSLYAAAMVTTEVHELDDEVWEDREVLQNFLHEKSISFSRNWFGDLIRTRGNNRVKLPVAHPKSMEMPMENLPDAGEWDEGWYTTWQTRNGPNNNGSSSSSYSDSGSSASDSYSRGGDTTFFEGEEACSQSLYTEDRSTYDEDDSTWEDAPECGTFLNVKLKIGERLSRIHPDHTSSLKRSRWRRKYFPQGTFPF